MAAWATLRRCRKPRRCECGSAIQPGEQYLDHVAAPDHEDVGNVGWWRLSECRGCAERYGRWPSSTGATVTA